METLVLRLKTFAHELRVRAQRLPQRLAPFLKRLPEQLRPFLARHKRRDDPLAIACVALLLVIAGSSLWFAYSVFRDLPDMRSIREIGNMARATTLLDAHDQPVFTLSQERRLEVPLTKMSPYLIHGIMAIEDQRFYDHRGVDLVRIAGAALRNVRAWRAAEGASTITQQLARQSLLTTDKTLRRKAREAIVASRIERTFSKNDILEMYLNKVYFGDGLYGAEAAALGFFGKHARDLDVAEAALLAGLVRSPSSSAPTINRDRALARRAVVLQAMRDSKAIDVAAYRAAMREPLLLRDALRHDDRYGQYFREAVRKQLVAQFGSERVYEGGLRVFTTIDLDMQKAAEAQVQRALKEIEEKQARARRSQDAPSPDPLQAALVALDPATGEVRALVGGRDFEESRFDRAMQARRQPGSAFKPFVYAAALERGYTPATLITRLNEPIATLQGAWVPEEGHETGDSITMRAALKISSNRAAVRVLQDVGIPETVSYAQRLGVGSVPSVPSLALGAGEVTLLSMTAAFATFANQGLHPTPILIRRVEGADGETLYLGDRRAERAISEETAFMMTSMLADVINGGTAWQARRDGFALPAAGKTGTTNDYKDVWFVGYTPKLVTGVWLGYDQPKTIIARGFAGDLAVPLWGRFMKVATAHDEPTPFRAPPDIVGVAICRISGLRASDGCRDAIVTGKDGNLRRQSTIYTEYFVRGTEPIDECHIHDAVLGVPGAVATTGGGGGAVAPVGTIPPSTLPLPAPPSPSSNDDEIAPQAPHTQTTEETPSQTKRGFWGRIFRRGSPKKD